MTEPAAQASRNIVVAVDATDACVAAVQYAVSEICRPGDVLHICHTAKVLPPPYTISHGKAGALMTRSMRHEL